MVYLKKLGSTSYALNPATTGAGWTITRISRYAATNAFVGTRVDAEPYAGDYALIIGNLPYGYIMSSPVAVTPGEQYDLTVYMRGQIDPDGSIGCWRVRATFLYRPFRPAACCAR